MGAPAELFTLIEQFLQDQGCVNALKAFQKDAKNVRSPNDTYKLVRRASFYFATILSLNC